MQKLADIIVIESLPLAASPGHTVLPARRTLSSGFYVLQAAPHPLKNLQGLSVSMAKSLLYKHCISAENSAAIKYSIKKVKYKHKYHLHVLMYKTFSRPDFQK